MTEGSPELRHFDDDTLLDMYENAVEHRDFLCDAIAAELNWRGIVVEPCGHEHGKGDDMPVTRDSG